MAADVCVSPPLAVSGTDKRADILEPNIRRDFLQSRVLVQIRLAPNEVVALQQPVPLYLAVPRLSYLPVLYDEVFQHFEEYIPPRMGQDYESWFDVDGIPLPWQYPIGVFVDAVPSTESSIQFLTVHFQNRPSHLLPFAGIGSLEPLFMNSLRESTFLSHASADKFMRLSKGAQATLWQSFLSDDFVSFSEAEKALHWVSLDQCKSLAIRWHIMANRVHEVFLSRISVFNEDDEPRTIKDELTEHLPFLKKDVDDDDEFDVEVRTLGTILPLNTPLYWICIHASYLDGFAHLVVHVRS